MPSSINEYNQDNITFTLDSDYKIIKIKTNSDDQTLFGYKIKDLIGKQAFLNCPLISSEKVFPNDSTDLRTYKTKYKEDLNLWLNKQYENKYRKISVNIKKPEYVMFLDNTNKEIYLRIVNIISLKNKQVQVVLCPDERETLRKNKELEHNLANQNLTNARNEAEHANQAKSDFLANISHELRTPLNAIMGYIQLLIEGITQRKLDYYKQIKYCKNIYFAANTLLELINKILDFTKIEAGKIELDYTSINITELIEQTLNMLTVKNTTIKTIYNIDQSVPHNIWGDQVRIQQILINIIENAFKFTEDYGQITVNASYDKNQNMITIKVQDTGIGIPQDKLKSIFEIFTQANGSTTRKYGGTGLGLTIAKELAQLMEGNITVKSKEGTGSTFTITFKVSLNPGKVPLIE